MFNRGKSDDEPTQQTAEERLEFAERREAAGKASQMATQESNRLLEDVVRNPQFVEEFTDPDVDSDQHDWLEDELAPEFSRAHVFGYRERGFEREVKWLGLNAAERYIAESTPGRTLKKHPDVLRVMQGAAYDPESGQTREEYFHRPMVQEERRVARGAFEVASNRKTLSVQGKGTDATTTATAEHRTVHNRDEEERSSARKAASKLFR